MQDPVFGPLVAARGQGVWEGSVEFPPTGRTVDLIIDAAPSQPDLAHHHRLYAELSARYDTLLGQFVDELPTGRDIALVAIDLRPAGDALPPIEPTYEETETSATHSVALEAWKPRLVAQQ